MATDRSVSIHVEGLRSFVRDLKAEAERPDKDLRKRLRGVAEKVAEKARSGAQGRSNPRAGSAVAQSIKSASSGADARVSIGSQKVPWALGHEFGSLTRRQFPPWRGSGSGAGYFFWPAIREANIGDELEEVLEEFAERVYPD